MAFEIGAGITIGGGITLEIPAAGGGGGGGGGDTAMVSGTITPGFNPMGGIYQTNLYGSSSMSPTGIFNNIAYNGSATIIYLNEGTFGSYTINTSGINNNSTLSVTIDGVTETSTDLGSVGSDPRFITWVFTGNPFSINNTTSHTISMSPASGGGGGGGATTFTVGDGKTVMIDTSTGASERIIITTIGQQSALASWTTTATLTRTGGSGTVAYDSEMDTPIDNGNGTWTYSFYVSPTNYPGDYSWDSMELAASGGGGGTTFTNSSTTFLGSGDAPPWVVTSVYNGGALFKIATAGTPSSEFISAINALTSGSQITIVDANEGTFTITLTSGFDGTYTTAGNEAYNASCTSTVGFASQITSITI